MCPGLQRHVQHHGRTVFLGGENGRGASPSAKDDGASVGPDSGACAGGLLSWTGLLGIPWKHNDKGQHTACMLPKNMESRG